MRRTMAPVAVLSLVLVFLSACGHGEDAKAAQHREEQLNEARAQIAKNTKQLDDLQEKLKGLTSLVQNNQANVDKSLQDIGEKLKSVSDSNHELNASLNPPAVAEKKSPATGSGWSLFAKIILGLVILGIFYILFKRLTRDEEEDDDLDSEFQEENDLGTVRYPGVQSPAAPEPKPGEGPSSKAS